MLLKACFGVLKKFQRSKVQMFNFTVKNCGQNTLLQLNRPEALNALNTSMVQEMYRFLKKAENSKSLVIVKGNDRSFCSGGDVKSVVTSADPNYGQEFFRQEYIMDALIATYSIPYVSLIDGIVMGGGVGISIHGKYRVATEKTVFAMPETAIGFFPDVGASAPLSKLSNNLGLYLGMTGARLFGMDVVQTKIATHFCEKQYLAQLEDELLNLKDPIDSKIEEVLKKYERISTKKDFALKSQLNQIENVFGSKSVEEIFTKLATDRSDWSSEVLATLNKMSPTSLKVTFKHFENVKSIDCIKKVFENDYCLAYRLAKFADFKEGVDAMLISKTKQPKWHYSRIEDVSDSFVDTFFEPLPVDQALKIL